MADEDKKGPKLTPDFDFGTYLAFFLPGVLALYALVPISPQVHHVFSELLVKDESLGASFVLLIGGLTVGTAISGIRTLLLDWIGKPKLDYSRLKEPDTLSAYVAAIANIYRFYQFYGNIALAIVFWMLVRYSFGGVDAERLLFYIVGTVVVLLSIQTVIQLRGTYKTLTQILGLETPALSIEGVSLLNGKINQIYTCPLGASGGELPITWSAAGNLPMGLTLDPAGSIGGTPTAQGTTQFILCAVDAKGETRAKQLSITIDPGV